MPDDQGNFQPGFSFAGRGGELRDGFLAITDLVSWNMAMEATDDPNISKVRLTVRQHRPEDQYTYDHSADGGLELDVPFGKKRLRGAARIVSRIPSLVIEAVVEVK